MLHNHQRGETPMWYKSAQFKSIVTMARFNQQILKFTKRLCKSSRHSQKTTIKLWIFVLSILWIYLHLQSLLPVS